MSLYLILYSSIYLGLPGGLFQVSLPKPLYISLHSHSSGLPLPPGNNPIAVNKYYYYYYYYYLILLDFITRTLLDEDYK